MNPVNFNSGFETALATIPDGLIRSREMFVSPIFDHHGDQEWVERKSSEITAMSAFSMTLKPPFPEYRLCWKMGELLVHYMVSWRPERALVFVNTPPSRDVWSINPSRVKGNGFLIYSHLNRAWLDPRNAGGIDWRITEAELVEQSHSAIKPILTFHYDCLLPTNRIASVQPTKISKSPEWISARTHHVLITHGHPANSIEITSGSIVNSDPTREITRMAHCRRAHLATLKHARFTFSRGKTIYRRSAWIGPKEWRSKGGSQLYRIIDPPSAQ